MGAKKFILAVLAFAMAGIAPVARAQEFALTRVSGGVYALPVRLNGALSLDFVLDTGAAEVSISERVVAELIRLGALAPGDILIERNFTDASGRSARRRRILLRSVRIGAIEVNNVAASISGNTSPLLLGQSFLSRLDAWSIDNRRRIFALGQPTPTSPTTAIGATEAEINGKDAQDRTPLMRAAARESADAVRSLLARGATVDLRDTAGWTALMFAAERGEVEIAQVLLAAGADVNARNAVGWTSLMTAATRGDGAMVKTLLVARADTRARNYSGWSVLMLARARSNTQVVQLLQQAGATE